MILGAIRNCLGPLCAWQLQERATDPTSPESSACSQSHLKTSEFRQHIKGIRPQRQSFRDQIDSVMRAISEELRRPSEMPDTIGIETHQARTREIRGYGIVGKNDLSEMPVGSVQRPVALHRDHAIRDDEVDRRRRADIENAAMDPLPVEKIFGPAILASPAQCRTCSSCSSVTPAQWCVLILGMDTTKSDASTVRGSHR